MSRKFALTRLASHRERCLVTATGPAALVGTDMSVRSSFQPAAMGKSVRTCANPVRSRAHIHSTVEVRVGASQGLVAESNCVVARWGGEQLEANWRSAGDELDSAEERRRACWVRAKSETHRARWRYWRVKRCPGSSRWLEAERWEVHVREVRRPAGWVWPAGVRALVVPGRRFGWTRRGSGDARMAEAWLCLEST